MSGYKWLSMEILRLPLRNTLSPSTFFCHVGQKENTPWAKGGCSSLVIVELWRGNHTTAAKIKFRTCESFPGKELWAQRREIFAPIRFNDQQCPNPSTPSDSSFTRLAPTPSWPSSSHHNQIGHAAIAYFKHLYINYLSYLSGFFPGLFNVPNKHISLLKANTILRALSLSLLGLLGSGTCQVHSKHAVNNYQIGM